MNAWKKNRLWVALAVLVVLVGLAVVGGQQSGTGTIAPEPETDDFPKLTASEIDELVIRRPGEGDATIELAKVDGSWRMVQPVEAEVEPTTVQTAVDKLGDLEVKRVAARDASNFERLEVGDDQGVHVTAKQDGQVLASVIIGSYGGGETMVRLADGNVVFAARGSMRFAFDKAPKDWRNRKVADVRTSRVQEVELTYGETTRRFVRGDGDEWQLADGEDPIERFSPAKVNGIVSSLAQMRATDFAEPEMTPAEAGLDAPAARATLRYRPVSDADAGDDEGEEGGEGEGEDDKREGEGSDEASAAGTSLETLVLVLGKPVDAEDGPRYLQVAGRDDVIYQVTNYYAEKMRPEVADLQEAEDSEEDEAEGAADAAAAPGGMPDLNIAGGSPDIPPEVMQKIQRQLQQQQQAAPGGGN